MTAIVQSSDAQSREQTETSPKTKGIQGKSALQTEFVATAPRQAWYSKAYPDHSVKVSNLRIKPSVKIVLTDWAKRSGIDMSLLIANILEYATRKQPTPTEAKRYFQPAYLGGLLAASEEKKKGGRRG